MAQAISNDMFYLLITELVYVFEYSLSYSKMSLLSKPPILKCMIQVGATNFIELFYLFLHNFEILVSYAKYI